MDVLTRLHARVIPIVRRHNGIVDKFMGDGIMVTFGAVHASAPPGGRCDRSALEDVLAASGDWRGGDVAAHGGERLSVNGAVAAGPVVFAVVGAEDRLEYTVIGEAVNLAAKLEKHNKVERTRGLATAHASRWRGSRAINPGPDCGSCRSAVWRGPKGQSTSS